VEPVNWRHSHASLLLLSTSSSPVGKRKTTHHDETRNLSRQQKSLDFKYSSEWIQVTKKKITDVPHLAENIRHLLTLLLSPLVCAQLSFSYLQCTLILANLKKLSDPLLIWCKTSNFPDQTPDKEYPLTGFLHSNKQEETASQPATWNAKALQKSSLVKQIVINMMPQWNILSPRNKYKEEQKHDYKQNNK